jgi:hypothetical protein
MNLLPRPWQQLQQLLNLRGNHMSTNVENVNKWAYFAQNIGWLFSIPVALTLIYSNLSARVDAQEKEITELRQQVADTSSRLDAINSKQNEQLVVLTEIKTIVEGAPKKPATQGN